MSNSSFFDDDEDDFFLPDGGDGGYTEPTTEADPEPAADEPAPAAPPRPAQRPHGAARPSTGSSSVVKPSRPTVARPAPLPAETVPDEDVEQEEVPAPAPARPAAPRQAQRPAPVPMKDPEPPRAVPTTPRTMPAPPVSLAKTVEPEPVNTPLLAGYEAHAGEAFNPFEQPNEKSAAEPERSFMDEVKPEDLSPQIDPDKEAEEERKKKSFVGVRRAKPKDEPSTVVSKKETKKNAKAKKSKKKADEEAEEFTRFSGKRNRVMVATIATGTIIALLTGLGVKQVLFPTTIPSPEVVTSTVSKKLGMTEFPEDSANGFVTSFVREYLTVNPETIGEKGKRLTNYTSDTLASTMYTAGDEETKISIAQGPYVSGVESLDDTRAVYTVAAQLSTGAWSYLKVPVYYDKETNGFMVYDMPSFVPKPQKAEMPVVEQTFQNDSALSEEVRDTMTAFFRAWGASDEENLPPRLTNSASVEAATGLEGTLVFSSLDSMKVEAAPEGVDPATVPERKATATVTWTNPSDKNVSYRQNYDLLIYKQPDNRWYVKDIDVATESISEGS